MTVFGLFKQKTNDDDEAPLANSKGGEQAIILRSVFESGQEFGTDEEREALYALEDELEDALSKEGFEHDGHDMGDGEFMIYCYGVSAEQMLPIIQRCIKNHPFIWYNVTLRYGAVDNDKAKEKHLRINARA